MSENISDNNKVGVLNIISTHSSSKKRRIGEVLREGWYALYWESSPSLLDGRNMEEEDMLHHLSVKRNIGELRLIDYQKEAGPSLHKTNMEKDTFFCIKSILFLMKIM